MSDVIESQDPEQPLEKHMEEQKPSDVLQIFAQDSWDGIVCTLHDAFVSVVSPRHALKNVWHWKESLFQGWGDADARCRGNGGSGRGSLWLYLVDALLPVVLSYIIIPYPQEKLFLLGLASQTFVCRHFLVTTASYNSIPFTGRNLSFCEVSVFSKKMKLNVRRQTTQWWKSEGSWMVFPWSCKTNSDPSLDVKAKGL